MPGTDLEASLGKPTETDALRDDAVQDVPWGAIALSGMGLIAISLVAFVMVTDERAQPRTYALLDPIVTRHISVPDLAPPRQTTTIMRSDDATSSIARTIAPASHTLAPYDKTASVAIVPRAPDEPRTALAPAPDPRLIAPGPHGALPRIGRDGARPAEVYARPVIAGARLAPGAPRVAIVVTGLGSNGADSERAINSLPGAVTFAFTPYGDNLDEQAEQARAAGHELLLQAPMEGAAGDRSTGPRTLAADAPRERALDALYWQMSRFSGYIGLTNSLGARFMSDPRAFSTLMQDVAERGLVFLDDGSAPGSLTSSVAAAVGAQAVRADIVLDGSPNADAIDMALRRLETLARERGSAIGVSGALPYNIDRIRRFAQGLEARGVALVPASALIEAPARTSAR